MNIQRISIRGKEFTSSDGYVSTATLNTVIVGANPNLSKSWYKEDWTEDSTTTTPDCYSLDGIAPSKYSNEPQNDICASCPQNAWGSRTTPTGQKVKACSDQKRLAIVLADKPDGEVYLLQVAPASLKSLNAYQKELTMRGIIPEISKTRLSFDIDVPYPRVRFSFGGFNTNENQSVVDKLLGTEQVMIITGELVAQNEQAPSAFSFGFTEEDGFTINTNELGGSND